MKFIDRAKSHFESLGVQHIEVEEWKDEAGNPSVIYWNPITLSEKNKLFKKSDNLNDVSILTDILIMKSLDKDGNKLFTLEDKNCSEANRGERHYDPTRTSPLLNPY